MSCAASKTTHKQSTTSSDVSSFPLKSANSAVKKRPEKNFVSDPASSEIQASVPADGSAWGPEHPGDHLRQKEPSEGLLPVVAQVEDSPDGQRSGAAEWLDQCGRPPGGSSLQNRQIRADQISGHCPAGLHRDLRLGAKALPQIHGLQELFRAPASTPGRVSLRDQQTRSMQSDFFINWTRVTNMPRVSGPVEPLVLVTYVTEFQRIRVSGQTSYIYFL